VLLSSHPEKEAPLPSGLRVRTATMRFSTNSGLK
jgi:hypothetical protein